MKARAIADPDEFLTTTAHLLSDEARNCLVLGVAGVIKTDPDTYPDGCMFLLEDDGVPVAAALVTPPRALILGDAGSKEAVAGLVRFAEGLSPRIPGVIGTRPVVEMFADRWASVTGEDVSISMNQGIFSLEKVIPPARPDGRSRRAVIADADLVTTWFLEFAREAMPHEENDRERIAEIVDTRISSVSPSGFWLWEVDGSSVSVSGHGGPTRSGIRIGPVYTPPEYRGSGYATALVADQSSALLADGYRFCFLYTDLANATSNEIYKRIGYIQVAESTHYAFNRR